MNDHRPPSARSSRNAACVPRPRTQGPVRYPPFEDVNDAAAREVAKYQIDVFGRIQQCCEHIPYNSTKKDFFEKTGRESIEGKMRQLVEMQKLTSSTQHLRMSFAFLGSS